MTRANTLDRRLAEGCGTADRARRGADAAGKPTDVTRCGHADTAATPGLFHGHL